MSVLRSDECSQVLPVSPPSRQVVPRELRSSQVRLGMFGSVATDLRALDGAMGSPDAPGTADVPAAPPLRGAVVSRYALFARLAESERVVHVSAPADFTAARIAA